MKNKIGTSLNALLMLFVFAVITPPAFAGKCDGQGVANGAALSKKIENGVCGQAPGTAPSAVVPEPSGLVLLATGLAAMGLRRIMRSRDSKQ